MANSIASDKFYRCAGPNCGVLKRENDRWWLMWTSFANQNIPFLYLCPWDEKIAEEVGSLHVWRVVRTEAAIAIYGQRAAKSA